MRSAFFVRLLALSLLVGSAAACAAASGYDPKRYPDSDASAPVDPDTVALAPAPKTSIADPRLGPLPPPPPASPPPPALDDAGAPDAAKRPPAKPTPKK